jgi:catechol 2,3-dioxygenase-like lactoylglutathione lyase family enzyme
MFDHCAIKVKDISREISLFTEVFGMQVTKRSGEESHPTQAWLDNVLQLNADPDGSSDSGMFSHLAFSVPDQETTIEELHHRGGTSLPQGRNWIMMKEGICLEILQQE